MKKTGMLLLLAAALLYTGCSSEPQQTPAKTTPTPEAAQSETGRFALQKMLVPAHLWAPDAQPVRLESSNMKGSNGHDGKAAFWRALFASPGRQKAEPFTWAGVATDDAPRGVNHGVEDTYNPANRSASPFDLNFLKTDTDQAFETAQQHGGKQVLEKDPKVSVTYLLDWDIGSNQLRWHVMYGGNESMGKLTVLVDASSGKFLRKE
ncbi:MAG TPA: hypothetical protein VFB79_00930 [Candidatus Angelobacter sp.]|nr:hypothetical protein [Candidatus Angelobacter sp.]